MQIKNTATHYGLFSIIFHWVLAILVIGLLGLGLYMTSLDPSPARSKLYALHKSVGFIILVLGLIRIIWRIINITPILSMPWWEKTAALIVHWAFYILVLAMPLSGWLMSSAAGYPVSFFGLFNLPNLIEKNDYWRHFFADAHEVLSTILIVLIVIHVLATLKHHYYDKDNTLSRILSSR